MPAIQLPLHQLLSMKKALSFEKALPDLMIESSSFFMNIFFSFCCQVSIEQHQPQHYIDHHKNIHISIIEEFAEINFR